jgi:dinuclear metal center YbgI/SA1388 family protein
VEHGLNTQKADRFFKKILDIEGFRDADSSLNGIQVDNDGAELRKIAFGVDASLETFKRAVTAGAGLLFVHHGLFWGKAPRIAGPLRGRIQYLLDHNLALYAVHLPLDQHPSLGNNAGLAELLGLQNIEPFGLYHGRKIGYKGDLPEALTIEAAAKRIAFMDRSPLGIYPFGKEKNRTCAVISGGAAGEAAQALEEGVDLFVTGEMSHEVYHQCLEGRLNMIAGGHYSTEVWGVRRVMEYCAAELLPDVEFIDVPTGL